MIFKYFSYYKNKLITDNGSVCGNCAEDRNFAEGSKCGKKFCYSCDRWVELKEKEAN